MHKINGIPASPGYAIGRAFVVNAEDLHADTFHCSNTEEEILRLDRAVKTAIDEIRLLQDKTRHHIGNDKADIFGAHILLLQDPDYIGAVKMKVNEEKINAEAAFSLVTQSYIAMFNEMNDEYMKERQSDIRDIYTRVLSHLLGKPLPSLSSLAEPVILIAEELTPSETAQLNPALVLGIVTKSGGHSSHSAIMARSLDIPAILGVSTALSTIKQDDIVIIDGTDGTVIVHPSVEQQQMYQTKWKQHLKEKEELKSFIDSPTVSLDGHRVELGANIGSPQDAINAIRYGADGIGLFRSEFLYMGRDSFPTEEEQFEAYKNVAEMLGSKPVIIRTLDIGGDKALPYLEIPKEQNPFLGVRALRFCLDRKDIFKVQLRAILRASSFGYVKVMYPMITTVQELKAANEILEEVKEELENENVAFNKDIQVGIMIEVPAAALISDILAKHVDFFSIGTNDLIQYTMAADRMNPSVANLYQPYHPAILRLIKMIIDGAHKEGKWVGMCGELAGDEVAVPLLLGLGLDEFSMSAPSILRMRKLIQNINKTEMKAHAEHVLSLADQEEVSAYLKNTIINPGSGY